MGKEKKLLICDVNQKAIDMFCQGAEGQGPVEVVSNGFEAAKTAVGQAPHDLDGRTKLICLQRTWF
jgi:hypothetical protein